MKKFLKILLILIFPAALFFGVYLNAVSGPISGNNKDGIVFVVKTGEGANKIAENLYQKDLIKSKFYFKFYLWNNNLEAKLQAGEYVLNQTMNPRDIVEILSWGRAVSKEKTIKIIEGWNIKDIVSYFEKEGVLQGGNFLEVVNKDNPDYRKNYEFLADRPKNSGLEGYLFPDTYKIYEDATPNDIVQKMLKNLDQKLTPKMRDDIKKQGKTIYEIITMASIIEKEVRSFGDMKLVSGVFWNRINSGRALESCASLAYILGVNKPQYTIEDTNIDSPYNTYKNPGLPPGPIANPGFNAITAAIYPDKTDYNYFLSASTGETIFSKTYDEHLRNKAKYLK